MLILGRRVGESIVIDGGVTVVVLACDRGGVRLGVRAPADVSVLRGELVRQVEDANRAAASPGDAARALAALAGLAPAPGGGAGAPPSA
jgi:carbon storage regulator